jgi:hypothetical protein
MFMVMLEANGKALAGMSVLDNSTLMNLLNGDSRDGKLLRDMIADQPAFYPMRMGEALSARLLTNAELAHCKAQEGRMRECTAVDDDPVVMRLVPLKSKAPGLGVALFASSTVRVSLGTS